MIYIELNNQSNEDYRVMITDLLGRSLFEKSFDGNRMQVQLSDWADPGLYIVHVIDDSKKTIHSKKIILIPQ